MIILINNTMQQGYTLCVFTSLELTEHRLQEDYADILSINWLFLAPEIKHRA